MENDISIIDIIALVVFVIFIGYNCYDCGRTKGLTMTVCNPGKAISVDTDKHIVVCEMPDKTLEARKY